MRWGLLFLALLIFGLLFEFSELLLDERWGKVDLFFRLNHQMYPSSYIYYAGETLTYIFLGLVVRHLMSLIERTKPYKHFATAFVILETIDFIDFWVTGNSLWFEYREYPITYNVVKVFIFTVLFGHELIHRDTSA